MPVPVVCALLLHDRLVMLAQRPAGKHLAMKWEFPGGKVEPGETAEAALHRELAEELGCRVQVMATLAPCRHVYERGEIELLPFVCTLAEDSPPPVAHEHAALTWVPASELLAHDLAPADVPVVRLFLQWLAHETASQAPNPG